MRVRDVRGLAAHEAAHAAVARRLGMRVDVASLVPQRGLAVWCSVVPSNLANGQRSVLCLVLTGPWAEGRALHLPGDVLPPGSDSDLAAAIRLSRELAGEHWRRALVAGFHDTASLLGEPEMAAEVEVVARECKLGRC